MLRVLLISGMWLLLMLPQLGLAAPASLTVRLTDHVKDIGIPNQAVVAYEKRADGSLVWQAKRITDSTGQAAFDLEGLGSGRTYIFQAQPFGYWVRSSERSTPGWFDFRLGKLQLQVFDGQTGAPKTGQGVVFKRWAADGNHVGVMAATTDAQGWVKVDPTDVGTVPFVVTAISPTDGLEKVSKKLWPGTHSFAIGHAPVVAQLKDAISDSGLPNQWVEVWEKQASGAFAFLFKQKSDASGFARFDLPGLAQGLVYQLRAQPFLQAVASPDITTPGPHVLAAGKLQVTVIDGVTGSPAPWRDVLLLEKQPDGSLKGIVDLRADALGMLKMDPALLGSRPYVLRANSNIDQSLKYSQEFVAGGAFNFQVGNPPITARLTDHVKDIPITNQEVFAYEKQADGSLVWLAKRITDANGLAYFDVDSIAKGKHVVLSSKPFGYWVSSPDITKAGWTDFRVGRLQVQVLDGQTGLPRANQAVSIKRWSAAGDHATVMSVTTDTQGWVKVDPLDAGRVAYVVTAISPTDGTEKISSKIWSDKPYFFAIGHAPVVAQLKDAISDSGLPNQWVEVWEKQASGAFAFLFK
ncbi:MAG: hypothetical protein AB1330_13050, partial [Bacillota bacterium]